MPSNPWEGVEDEGKGLMAALRAFAPSHRPPVEGATGRDRPAVGDQWGRTPPRFELREGSRPNTQQRGGAEPRKGKILGEEKI